MTLAHQRVLFCSKSATIHKYSHDKFHLKFYAQQFTKETLPTSNYLVPMVIEKTLGGERAFDIFSAYSRRELSLLLERLKTIWLI